MDIINLTQNMNVKVCEGEPDPNTHLRSPDSSWNSPGGEGAAAWGPVLCECWAGLGAGRKWVREGQVQHSPTAQGTEKAGHQEYDQERSQAQPQLATST